MVIIEEDIREKVKKLLRELFQFENENLDFGIYRVMNFKRAEIEKFIDQDLVSKAEQQFKDLNKEGQKSLIQEIEQLKSEINRDFGAGTIDDQGHVKKNEDAPKIKDYLSKINLLTDSEISEVEINEVFNHVYEFFSRYYDKGDFLSKRRYGSREKYYVPYNGQEVVLHWANNDQYYVKTAEHFNSYIFREGPYRFRFILTEAESNDDNSAEKRFFFLANSDFISIDEEKKTVDFYFNYKGLSEEDKKKFENRNIQEALSGDAVSKIFSEIENKPVSNYLKAKKGEKTVLGKHLDQYVRSNSSDYFIHKNLREFLERELEFYIKNEVLDVNLIGNYPIKNVCLEQAKIKAIKEIGEEIIAFLAQIEDFQKMLWSKKKLVTKTDYIISLDKIACLTSKEFFETAINQVLKNFNQIDEWKRLLGVTISNKTDLIDRQTFSGIEWKKLPIDTKFFNDEFKLKLLDALTEKNSLDSIIDGIAIKSENFQALSLIQKKYSERIKVVYIDPPYNTGNDEFLYKDNYQHSSWLALMNDRLDIARDLMTDDGVLFIHIDENEQFRLRLLLDGIFNSINYVAPLIWLGRAGKGGTVAKIQVGHEYVECIAKNKTSASFKPTVKEVDACNYSDKKSTYRRELLRQWGSQAQRREDRPSMYFPIPLPFGGEAYPKLPDGSDGRWRFGLNTVMKMLREGDLDFVKDEKTGQVIVYRKIRLGGKTISAPDNILDDVGTSADGTKDIQALFNEKVFDTCKPIKLAKKLIDLVTWAEESPVFILDFFAGSGTTGDAVLRLNKEDGKKRRFILIEMGAHLDTVVIPRLKKVAYSFNWKDGKPVDTNGLGILCKYQSLEQYDDSLNNIQFVDRDKTVQQRLDGFKDYFLNYMLDYETKVSSTRIMVEKFALPFDYRIRVTNGSSEKAITVDLVETFNYLLGLLTERTLTLYDEERQYRAVLGTVQQKKVAIIWRDLNNLDLKQDKAFIENKILGNNDFDIVYVNGDSYLNNSLPIEPEFKKLMGE